MKRLHRPGVVLTVLGLALMALAPTASGVIDTGTVIVKVKYRDTSGNLHPLPGVEVFLWDTSGQATGYRCTNAKGRAKFTDVPANTDLWAATGRAVALPCSNPNFLNPDGERKMWWVAYDNQHGLHGPFSADYFQVTADGKVVIVFKPKAPDKQWKVCDTAKVTIKGTNGDDAGASAIQGTGGPDVIAARGGDDEVHGLEGNDLICGGKGNDELHGDIGNDRIFGEQGRDELYGGGQDDYGDGGPKHDKCFSDIETMVSCEELL